MKPFRSTKNIDRRSFLLGTGAVATGLTLLPYKALAAEDKALNFYNWDTYIGETTLDDFKEETGIEVKLDLFADNDELFAKLKEGNPGYDVIIPSDSYVARMREADMLVRLDHDKIPNMANIEPPFLDTSFDPQRNYSLPYMWGTIGVGYRKSKTGEAPTSWKWLYDSGEYSGRVALLGDGRTVLGQALKYLGYSLNATDPAEVKRAEELITAQKQHIKVFADDNGQDLLASGEVDIAQEWNGDILQVMAEDEDLGFTVPDEGALIWEDGIAIPMGAPHPDNAHAFINYLLGAEAGAKIADFIQYATPNAAAKKLMSQDYLENPAIFPSEETLARCEYQKYLGVEGERLYDEAWTRINAA
jgi:spermidine/putrescine transport system substrate-binding protein